MGQTRAVSICGHSGVRLVVRPEDGQVSEFLLQSVSLGVIRGFDSSGRGVLPRPGKGGERGMSPQFGNDKVDGCE